MGVVPRRKPELLAPAGTYQAFLAALNAGADAIYLGLDTFNARRNADNFTLETLEAACRAAHLAGTRVYLTANILIGLQEMPQALQLVSDAWERGVDAVIVQDIGFARQISRLMPEVETHTSTQMNLLNRAGIRFARELGASRVTLARELSVDEISVLSREGCDLEVFGHGALCVSYSGQCLMSSLIGRRSANRGLCAQPCRLAWDLLDADGTQVKTPGEHLLSCKDLCTADILPAMIDAGVASLKVEGRMKSPEYVALVCGVYRSCIDRAFADPEHYRVTDDERSRLEEAFSRGFTTAYLEGNSSNTMMSFARPNNRGVNVGRVKGIADGLVAINLAQAVHAGDTLEFWTGRGRHAQRVESLFVNGVAADAAGSDDVVQLVVNKPVSPGDRVFRVRNAAFAQEAGGRAGQDGVPCELDVTVRARIGEPIEMIVRDKAGRQGRATGRVVEQARTKAITVNDVREHIGRLGNTRYTIGSFEVELDGNVGMGFSQLHHLRRDCLSDYEGRILEPYRNRTALFNAEGAGVLAPQAGERHGGTGGGVPEVAAYVNSAQMAASCVEAGAEMLYMPIGMLSGMSEQLAGIPHSKLIGVLPTIIHEYEWDRVMQLVPGDAAVVCDDVASVAYVASLGATVEAGPHAYAINPSSCKVLREQGASRLWLTPELSLAQVRDLARCCALPLTLCVAGAQELMITEHCELESLGGCGKSCPTCGNRERMVSLRDGKGYVFPLTSDAEGRGHIFNSVELDTIHAIGELYECGVSRFVVDARLMETDHAVHQVRRAVVACRSACGKPLLPDDPDPLARTENTTTGHLFRGVL